MRVRMTVVLDVPEETVQQMDVYEDGDHAVRQYIRNMTKQVIEVLPQLQGTVVQSVH